MRQISIIFVSTTSKYILRRARDDSKQICINSGPSNIKNRYRIYQKEREKFVCVRVYKWPKQNMVKEKFQLKQLVEIEFSFSVFKWFYQWKFVSFLCLSRISTRNTSIDWLDTRDKNESICSHRSKAWNGKEKFKNESREEKKTKRTQRRPKMKLGEKKRRET